MSPDLLRQAVGCTPERAALYADPLSVACAFYGIDTPVRLAAFLAQIGHESGALRYTTELWGPTPAQARYEGRADLGNTQPGDGERFKGRGLIQTTGRFNHARVRDRLRERFPDVPDFEAEPERLAEPQWAALSATDYWDWKGLNALADAGSFELITRRINGGLNGYADRLARWKRAQEALKAEPVPTHRFAPDTVAALEAAPASTVPEPQPNHEGRTTMPLAPIIGALLPGFIKAIPDLGKLFGGGSEVAERNVKAAEIAVDIVQQAVGARNAQEAAEIVATSPEMAVAAQRAVADRWYELTEAGGGGIEGARKADAAAMGSGGPWWQIVKSPSFVMACLLLPLVYLIVLSIIGLVGNAEWSADVRAAIAGTIVGSIVGGLVGYYYGQTTSRNRTPSTTTGAES